MVGDLETVTHKPGDPFDIALIKTSDPIVMTPYVKPIPLMHYDEIIRDGQECVVPGWGATIHDGGKYMHNETQKYHSTAIGYIKFIPNIISFKQTQ